jgi:hypothetical protein
MLSPFLGARAPVSSVSIVMGEPEKRYKKTAIYSKIPLSFLKKRAIL